MRFFYNKLTYLIRRHESLKLEGIKRGLKLIVDPQVNMPSEATMASIVAWWWQDYSPTLEAIQINRDRLAIRRRYDGGLYT